MTPEARVSLKILGTACLTMLGAAAVYIWHMPQDNRLTATLHSSVESSQTVLQNSVSGLVTGASTAWQSTQNAVSDFSAMVGDSFSFSSAPEGLAWAKPKNFATQTVVEYHQDPLMRQRLTLDDIKIARDENRDLALAAMEPAVEPKAEPKLEPVTEKVIEPAVNELTPISKEDVKEKAQAKPWKADEDQLALETVLVPRQFTVISSSQDGKIADILFDNGDAFSKGDVLVKYDCTDLEAEASMAGLQTNLTRKKVAGVNELFKLDIISDLDRAGVETEDKQARAKLRVLQSRLDDCTIRAQFSGRVTKRLANAGEYTRTDRVLMEVASTEPLQAKFLLPSKWLRWVNVGAPVDITLNETDKTYSATVTRVSGEIDPVSQSIQLVATLHEYADPLLPGMSGKVSIDLDKIRAAGIKGYLETASRN